MLNTVKNLLLLALLLALPCTPLSAQFKVFPPKLESGELRDEAKALHDSGILQALVKELNDVFVLPTLVKVMFAECGEANAYFSSEDMEISMCIELMEDMRESLAEDYPNEDDREAIVEGALTATFLHEVGHALVSVLELPITGREEDVVDQLSTWILVEGDMADSVLSAAEIYYLAEDSNDDESFADEHSLNRQRYFNMVCWVYGSDAENNQALLDEWELPEARAEQCESEYAQLSNSWVKLLGDHIRE